jgi:hypothetical protein
VQSLGLRISDGFRQILCAADYEEARASYEACRWSKQDGSAPRRTGEPPHLVSEMRGYGDARAEILGELSTDLQVLGKQCVPITVRDSPRRHPA